jgi:drug/metabolite transporter (DMT)-like permease
MFARFHDPHLPLVLATLFWPGDTVVGRVIHGKVPPFALVFRRWTVALALTLPFALPPAGKAGRSA